MTEGWFPKLMLAAVPLLVGGLATIAWENAGNPLTLAREYGDLKSELDHQRGLLEQRLAGCK